MPCARGQVGVRVLALILLENITVVGDEDASLASDLFLMLLLYNKLTQFVYLTPHLPAAHTSTIGTAFFIVCVELFNYMGLFCLNGI